MQLCFFEEYLRANQGGTPLYVVHLLEKKEYEKREIEGGL